MAVAMQSSTGSDMLTDGQLIDSYRASDDRAALDELLGRHLDSVRAMVHRIVLDEFAADDVTQEVFVRAIRGLKSFEGTSQFSTWLYRIAVNTATDHLRRREPVAISCDTTSEETLSRSYLSKESGPVAVAVGNELAQQVNREIAALSPALRTAMVLTSVEGHDNNSAAQIAGCTSATMYWRVHRARKILKLRLARHLS
jgi:RNA polymerase sigma-70 factor (ECF subfamily)